MVWRGVRNIDVLPERAKMAIETLLEAIDDLFASKISDNI